MGRRLWVKWTARVVAVVFVGGVFQAVPAVAAADAPKPKKSEDVPALDSAEQKRPAPEVPKGDFRNQPAFGDDPSKHADKKDRSKSFDREKSKVVKREARSDVYRNQDGTYTAILRTEDVNWQDDAGNWHPIDPTLVSDGLTGWKNKSGKIGVRVTGVTGPEDLASVSGPGWSIGYRLEGIAPGVKAKVSGRTATYADVLPDVDIELRTLTEGVKEHVVLKKEPKTPGDVVLRFPLTTTGVTAREQADGAIAFVDGAGATVATMPAAVIWDADQAPAEGEGLVEPLRLVSDDAGGQSVVLTVAESWLRAPARRYPVTIDPAVDAGHATTQYDAFGSKPDPNGNYNGARQFWDGHYVDFVGYDNYPTSEQYTYQYFDLAPVMGATILSAEWRDWTFLTKNSGYYRMWPVAESWSDSTITWNTLPNHRPEYKDGYATAGSWEYMDVRDWVQNWASGAWPSRGISLDTAGINSAVRFAATEEGNTLNEAIYITYNRRPTRGEPTAPGNGDVLMTDQPTFTGTTGTDPDGDALSYWFRVSTSADGYSGSLLNSGGLATPSWTPPAGSLVDGMTYYWRMYTGDGVHWEMSDVRSFKVNLRLGASAVSPSDAVGPVSVNLANGNLNLGVSSRSFDTVGGPLGVSYTYNSKVQQQHGLVGTYTNSGNAAWDRLVRRDPRLDFNWGPSSPGPSISADYFDVTWDGYITVPYQANNWYFGAAHDDNVTITVNNTVVYDAGCCRGFDNPGFGSALSLFGGHTVPITVTLREITGQANFQLWTMGPVYGIVPASWLSTTPPPLPQGWSMSVDAGGAELSYSKAVVGNDSLVLHEPSGVVHEYRKVGDGWRPVDGDDDVVTVGSESGTTVFVVQGSDGIVYTFNGKGQLIRAVSATDDRNPAAARYYYNTTTARLQTIEDPVSLKRIELMYAFPIDGGVVVSSPCPKTASAGLNFEPPIGMLCKVTYWDGSSTNLYYKGEVQDTRVLARIEDPGGQITDFAYDGNGRPVAIRDPLAVDMVAAGTRANDDTTRSLMAYDGAGRVSLVTLPAPLANEARPAHAYAYPASTQTDVSVAGLLQPGVFNLARRVTFDGAGRLLTDRDTAGLITTSTWDAEDKQISQVQPGGLKTSYVYDHADRVVEAHGPAPSSCFGVVPTEPGWVGERPNSSCSAAGVPVSRTAYDEGMRGLAAEYWRNTEQSGASVSHATVGDATGRLVVNWGTSAPDGVLPQTDNWSSRFTGEIVFPTAGTYSFTMCSDDGVRLFVDDHRILADWTAWAGCRNGTATVSIATPGTRKRILVDHMEAGGAADVGLYWIPPGGSQQLVPGDYLAPRYGLVTSTVDPDGKKAATEYARPEYGQATASVTDPAGLNLRTVTDYEAPGTGYFRRTRRALPKGNATTYAFYASGESAPSNECNGTSVVGLFKSEIGPAPASGTAITRRAVYDSLHRIVGRKVDGDAKWSCTTYDARGRTLSFTDTSNKTTSFVYATPGQVTTSYADSGGTARSTVEKVDLLGRLWSYTDEHGTTTRRTFDQAGRPLTVFRTMAGGSESKIVEDAYNSAGRLASSTEWLSLSARTTTYTYDTTTGRLTATTRPNGVTTTTTYDANRGDVVGLSHTGSGMTTSSWTYSRSAARRVTSEQTTGRTRSFTYDGAGRLTRTVEGTTTRDYAYDANTNRCARATSCTTPTYTYDNTDRVLTSPEYSSYTYDGHGNMTQAVPRTQPPGGSLNQTFPLNPASPSSYEIIAGQAGTVSASLDWTGSAPTYTTQTATGSVAASGTKTTTVPVDGMSYVTADLGWTQGTRTQTSSLSGSVSSGSSSTTTLPVTATGTISVSTNWSSSDKSSSWSGSVPNLGQDDRTITVSANGTISASLSWPAPAFPNPNPDLDLELRDSSGTVVATGTPSGDNDESFSYSVIGMGAYPSTVTYTLRVKAPTLGSTYSLSANWPVTADVDIELYNPSGTKVAQATGTSSKPETLTYTVPSGGTGNYVLKALSKDHFASINGSASYPTLAYADLTLNLKNPSGTTVATTRSSSGAASLTYRAASGGTYVLQIVNNSSDLAAPSTSLPWSTTTQGSHSWSGTNVAASGTRSTTVSLDGDGWVTSDLTWTQGTRARTDPVSGSVSAGGSTDRTFGVTATGAMSASVDWSSSSASGAWSGTVANVGHDDRTITVSANGTISASLSWPTPAFPNPNPDLDLELRDSSGTVVATGTPSGDNAESLSYSLTGMGAYPATRTYTLRVKAPTLGSSYSLSAEWPVTADVDLELYNPSGTKVAQATGTSSKPESVSYTVPSGSTGTYTLTILSKNHAASFSGSATYQTLAHANVTLRLKNPSGTVAATASGSSGSATLNHRATAGGTWSLELVNNSTDLTVPSFAVTSRVPRTHTTTTLQLKNAAGTVVAQNASADKPKSISTAVTAGKYFLVVTPTNGGTATLTASYPGRPARQVITYDANDHATSVDDGTTLVSEALSPSGRVIRRTVKDVATQEVLEDALVGYADGGDNAAYSKPVGSGVVTTYLGGVVYTGTTASWQLANLHGDVVATVDMARVLATTPATDEFGVGQAPASRLGWLGAHQRFAVGGTLGLVRMGVRLYDPSLGRFTGVDPIEGGSANDYSYCSADSVNCFDLDGLADNNKQKKKKRDGLRRQVTIHKQKIRDERQKEIPNQGLIDHWQLEIDNWNRQIDALNKKLSGGNLFTRVVRRAGRGIRRFGEAVRNVPRMFESSDCPRGGIACTR